MLSLSADGRTLCFPTPQGAAILSLDTAGQRKIELPGVERALAFSNQVWVVVREPGGLRVRRYSADGVEFGAPLTLPELSSTFVALPAPIGSPAAILHGATAVEVRDDCGRLTLSVIGEDLALVAPIAPQTWIAAKDGALWLRRPDGALRLEVEVDLESTRLCSAHPLFEGTSAVVEVLLASSTMLLVVDSRLGTVRHRFRVDKVSRLAVARKLGHAVLFDGGKRFTIFDLRFGVRLREWQEPGRVSDFAVDGEGRRLAVVRAAGPAGEELVIHGYRDLLAGHRRAEEGTPESVATAPQATTKRLEAGVAKGLEAPAARQPRRPTERGRGRSRAAAVAAAVSNSTLAGILTREAPRAAVAASTPAGPTAPVDPPAAATPIGREALGALPLEALWPRPAAPQPGEEELVESLESNLELVAAWCRRAIAVGWDSGRISVPTSSDPPFRGEVIAILDAAGGLASEEVQRARQRAARIENSYRRRWRQTGRPTLSPLPRLTEEFGLSELGADILLVLAAPLLWGELARVYGIVANDPGRPLCDELLVGQLLGPERASRREVARELDPDQPLVRHGLVEVGGGTRPFAALAVPEVVVARFWGRSFDDDVEGGTGALAVRSADRLLSELFLPDEVVAGLVGVLRLPRAEPIRVVLRGRPGSGRRTLFATLAARARRRLGLIDVSALSRGRAPTGALLRTQLRAASLRGWLPCVSGLEHVGVDEPALRDQLREVFRTHHGPVFFRCAPEATPPLDPGYLVYDLPILAESQRLLAWRDSLKRRALPEDHAEGLAARYRLGPGTVERVVAQAAAEVQPEAADLGPRLEAALQQQREARIAAAASRVERLASWSDVILLPEIHDSLREFVARLSHRRTVFERWGFDRIVTSARGLTALFQGGPGTGKSMVAGVIARELGYQLYRVDLARILSKWIGETEKNLGAVFDAAEEGEVVLLFDEADALFTKRTEVKSSVDRYANVEVNYLLQRLDAFEGVAILTTNFGTAIDAAFKRRFTLRLTFPFPDEEARTRLWQVHLPRNLPIAGPLDLAQLAGKYELSGGYIRNAALRAAFLAAQEDRPLCQEHLERAVRAEYREVGKIYEGGVLE